MKSILFALLLCPLAQAGSQITVRNDTDPRQNVSSTFTITRSTAAMGSDQIVFSKTLAAGAFDSLPTDGAYAIQASVTGPSGEVDSDVLNFTGPTGHFAAVYPGAQGEDFVDLVSKGVMPGTTTLTIENTSRVTVTFTVMQQGQTYTYTNPLPAGVKFSPNLTPVYTVATSLLSGKSLYGIDPNATVSLSGMAISGLPAAASYSFGVVADPYVCIFNTSYTENLTFLYYASDDTGITIDIPHNSHACTPTSGRVPPYRVAYYQSQQAGVETSQCPEMQLNAVQWIEANVDDNTRALTCTVRSDFMDPNVSTNSGTSQ